MDDSELQKLAGQSAEGDLNAAEALIRACHGPLFSFLYLLSIPETDIDDVAQNTVIQMYQALARYDTSQPFLPWLRSIARHVAANFWRARKRERQHRSSFQDYLEHEVAGSEEEAIVEIASHNHLDECMKRLSPRQQKILSMSYTENRTSADISELLKATPMAIRQILCRTRELLRRCLESSPTAAG